MGIAFILDDTLLQDGCPDCWRNKNLKKSSEVRKNLKTKCEQFSPLRLQVVVCYLWRAVMFGTQVDVTYQMRIARSLTLDSDRIFMFRKVEELDLLLLNSWGVHCIF